MRQNGETRWNKRTQENKTLAEQTPMRHIVPCCVYIGMRKSMNEPMDEKGGRKASLNFPCERETERAIRGGTGCTVEREREKASNCINVNEEKSEYWYMNLTVHLLCIMLLWAVFCRIHRFIIGTKPLWMLDRNINSENNFRLRRSKRIQRMRKI